MVDFASAIKRPFEDKKTLFISFILAIFSFLLIPALLLLGFAAHTAKNSLDGKKGLPTWGANSLVEYLVRAIIIILINFSYGITGFIILGFSFGSAFMNVLQNWGNTAAMSNAIINAGLVSLIGVFFLLLGGLFAQIAVMNFLKSGKIADAFALKKIAKKVFTVKYFVSVVFSVCYFILLTLFAGSIPIFTFGVGAFVLNPGIMFYLYQNTMFEVMAETFKETP